MRGVNVSKLLAILVGWAMLFAPLAMQSGAAMAAMPADHHSQMAKTGHCGDQPDSGTDSPADGKSCCVAMCTAIAIAPVAPLSPLAFPPAIDRPALAHFGPGFLAKLPTPPPRFA